MMSHHMLLSFLLLHVRIEVHPSKTKREKTKRQNPRLLAFSTGETNLGCLHDGQQSVLWQWECTSCFHHAAHQLTHLPPGLHHC